MSAAGLIDALREEEAALKAGRFDALPELQAKKEACAAALSGATEEELRLVSQLAEENAGRLAMALDACRSARRRLDGMRGAPSRIGYNERGGSLTVGGNSGKIRC